jgi:hypothetical protein
LPVYDLCFRPLFIFFILELGSRRIVHFRVTRSPTDEWTAQMERSAVLREATAWGDAPSFLISENDSKYGASFTRVAKAGGVDVLRTLRTPKRKLHEGKPKRMPCVSATWAVYDESAWITSITS